GAIAALNRGRWPDRLVTTVSSFFVAIPPFVLSLLAVVFFAVQRRWFPATGYTPLAEDPWEWFRHLALPAVGPALPSAAEMARHPGGSLVDTLEAEFIRTQHAKGLSMARIVGKHAAKNSPIPVVTVLGLQLGRLRGGADVVQRIFVLP